VKAPLVSIIIPTYNRAHLIGETLDTILAQTYQHWECLIVDDGSTDNSQTVFEQYSSKDARFKFFNRPATRPKGANACRNMGLENAQGEYIVFFDSDDFMTPDHLEVKVGAIEKHQTDFVISKTKNLNGQPYPKYYYTFDSVPLTVTNYLLREINWVTLDVIIKQEVIEDIRFNEKLQSGQEFNFYTKLLCKTTNHYFVDKYLSHRRHHDQSIRSTIDSRYKSKKSRFIADAETYIEVKSLISNEDKAVFLISFIKTIYEYQDIIKNYRTFIRKEIYGLIGSQGVYFDMMLMLLKINKAYKMRNKLIAALAKHTLSKKINIHESYE